VKHSYSKYSYNFDNNICFLIASALPNASPVTDKLAQLRLDPARLNTILGPPPPYYPPGQPTPFQQQSPSLPQPTEFSKFMPAQSTQPVPLIQSNNNIATPYESSPSGLKKSYGGFAPTVSVVQCPQSDHSAQTRSLLTISDLGICQCGLNYLPTRFSI
jgi:hypothetical protein